MPVSYNIRSVKRTAQMKFYVSLLNTQRLIHAWKYTSTDVYSLILQKWKPKYIYLVFEDSTQGKTKIYIEGFVLSHSLSKNIRKKKELFDSTVSTIQKLCSII